MEGKSPALSIMMMGVLLMSLFLASTPVQAQGIQPAKICCKSPAARTCWNSCMSDPSPCLRKCGCGLGLKCPPNYPYLAIGVEASTYETYSSNEFCRLGCTSSLCSNIIPLHESTAPVSELELAVNEATKSCSNACFQLCNKNPGTAVVAAK